jgi:uncharacterized oxidoreductase
MVIGIVFRVQTRLWLGRYAWAVDQRAGSGWRLVTDAVHKSGSRIFAQLWHTGAISHPDLRNGALPVSASDVDPGQISVTREGRKPTVAPRPLTRQEIKTTVSDFASGARNAIDAGFDGVQILANYLYLIAQFLNRATNLRTDDYGGTIENRARFLFEVVEAVLSEVDANRVGMKISMHESLTDNTIFITGGGSGIGRGLAEALHQLGNKVIISGRRRGHLDAVVAANSGMDAVELDIADPTSIEAVASKLIANYPELNILINNAGIMLPDQAAGAIDEELLTSTVATNFLGPVRLTSALIGQLKRRRGTIIYNTSVLAFVPLALTAIYSATKAALHSYVLSQRFLLKGSGVRVLEIAPPWVRTELMNSQEAKEAMPLDQFIRETMQALGTDADEIVVERAKPLRANRGPEEHGLVNGLNEHMVALFSNAS